MDLFDFLNKLFVKLDLTWSKQWTNTIRQTEMLNLHIGCVWVYKLKQYYFCWITKYKLMLEIGLIYLNTSMQKYFGINFSSCIFNADCEHKCYVYMYIFCIVNSSKVERSRHMPLSNFHIVITSEAFICIKWYYHCIALHYRTVWNLQEDYLCS